MDSGQMIDLFSLSKTLNFTSWTSLNDSIMGGSSDSICQATPEGLRLQGHVIEEGGGFVSCRSPMLSTPVNLSAFSGIQITLDGEGREMKLAIFCKDSSNFLDQFFRERLFWVAPLPTSKFGTSTVKVLFSSLEPTIRATSISPKTSFDSSKIIRFQFLYSKFGQPGSLNKGFKEGPISVLFRSINVFT